MGYVFVKKTSNTLEMRNMHTNSLEVWDLLVEIPFTSERQCMTVMIKNKEDTTNTVYVMSKGSDTRMIELCALSDKDLELTKGKVLL